MQEVWVDIKGYEDAYQISNHGNVRSKDRRVVNNQKGTTRICYGTRIAPFDNGGGYLVVALRSGKKKINHYVHRLVAKHFLPNPNDEMYVNHIDYDKTNNDVSNLEWCSQEANIHHSLAHICKPKSRSKLSNTGEKYISYTRGRFRVCVPKIGVDKKFRTFEGAIGFRDRLGVM